MALLSKAIIRELNLIIPSCGSDDRKEGRGIFETAEGEVYDGEFKDGKFHGWGSYTWVQKERYSGEWIEGSQTGFGIQTWPDGQTYKGFWKGVRSGGSERNLCQGKKDGYGEHVFPSGGHYKGWWKTNVRDGFVYYTFPDGDVSYGR